MLRLRRRSHAVGQLGTFFQADGKKIGCRVTAPSDVRKHVNDKGGPTQMEEKEACGRHEQGRVV